MCLSTVYKNGNLLCKNIAKVEVKDDRLIFTDIMGIKTEVEGTVSNIDLLENIISVSGGEAS